MPAALGCPGGRCREDDGLVCCRLSSAVRTLGDRIGECHRIGRRRVGLNRYGRFIPKADDPCVTHVTRYGLGGQP